MKIISKIKVAAVCAVMLLLSFIFVACSSGSNDMSDTETLKSIEYGYEVVEVPHQLTEPSELSQYQENVSTNRMPTTIKSTVRMSSTDARNSVNEDVTAPSASKQTTAVTTAIKPGTTAKRIATTVKKTETSDSSTTVSTSKTTSSAIAGTTKNQVQTTTNSAVTSTANTTITDSISSTDIGVWLPPYFD